MVAPYWRLPTVDSTNVKIDNTGSIKAMLEQQIEAVERYKVWFPPAGRDRSLDLYIEMVKEDIINNISYKTKGSINEKE